MAGTARGFGTMTGPQSPKQVRYYAVEDRPVKVESTGPSNLVALVLDLTTGAFVPDPAMLTRVASGAPDVEELSKHKFQRLVKELRRSASYDRQTTQMTWWPTGDPEYPYTAELGGAVYTLYYGDFPGEPMYRLLVEGQVVDSLDQWPRLWTKDSIPSVQTPDTTAD
ncbi:MAG: hypothetical protein M3441_03065 [Chloroflexota bacterium]|nr:hypothetical protein [Chloroflexota bacterium]